MHEGRKDFPCPKCDKCFSQSGHLSEHISYVHEGKIKDFKCSICGKNYRTKDNLNKHVSTVHEGRKDYACQICGKAFTTNHALKRHISGSHKGEKEDMIHVEVKEECDTEDFPNTHATSACSDLDPLSI